MSSVKTKISESLVKKFLSSFHNADISSLHHLKGGEISQAFSYKYQSEELVIRVNTRAGTYSKDVHAWQHFEPQGIPVPEIFETGSLNSEYYFAISKKVPGSLLKDLSNNEYRALLPEIFKSLDAIHSIDISNSAGFGAWQTDDISETSSWKDYILAVDNYAIPKDGNNNQFETTFLEQVVWEKTYKSMSNFLSFCPEIRYLVHGDFGSDNVLARGNEITGILDWEGSKYGDFLYDVAWLNFWNPDRNPISLFREHYSKKDSIKNFQERITCYQLRIVLSSLSFYAFSNQLEKYQSTKDKLNRII